MTWLPRACESGKLKEQLKQAHKQINKCELKTTEKVLIIETSIPQVKLKTCK